MVSVVDPVARTEVFPDPDQMAAHFNVLNPPGEVREVRILDHVPVSGYGGPSTASGYFDNPESLVEQLQAVGSHHATGIFITQNPVDPDLLARAHNRIKRKVKYTTADADVTRLAHWTVDCDPVRKAGISATDAELAQALAVRDAAVEFLTAELGWPDPVMTMLSGNGGHATWRIDLPADNAGRALVEAALKAVAALFGTDEVSVDTTLSNPSRVVKLAGTVAGKGDPLPHRPHRRSHAVFSPDAGTVTEAQLRALVVLMPQPAPRPQNGLTLFAGARDAYDVPVLLRSAGIGFSERTRGDVGVYRLDRCLSSEDHTDGAAILQFASGAVAYRCHHNRCADMGWQHVKHRLGIQHGAETLRGSSDTPSASSDRWGATRETPWPELDPAALYGLAGDVVRAIEPHTEGDRAALLVNFLLLTGSAIGSSPYAPVGATRHHANLFAVHVGETARSRKGTAHSEAERLLRLADQTWKERVMGGLSSGEGLVHSVRDASYKFDKDGNEVIADAGVDDKRIVAVEPEFASVLRVAARDGNTLTEVLRRAWDGNDLRVMTRNSPLKATAPHVSLSGHITRDELLRELDATDQVNGFANRFLFLCVRRSKLLPHGGTLGDFEIHPIVRRIWKVLASARRVTKVERDAEANAIWEAVYPILTAERPGMFGAITARAEAQCLRLSLVYALLDEATSIQRPHLEAALALWQYCEDSARFIFGDATGDAVADHILTALRTNGQMTQTQISELFGRNQKAGRLQRALASLLNAGKVRTWQGESSIGRPPIYWEAMS